MIGIPKQRRKIDDGLDLPIDLNRPPRTSKGDRRWTDRFAGSLVHLTGHPRRPAFAGCRSSWPQNRIVPSHWPGHPSGRHIVPDEARVHTARPMSQGGEESLIEIDHHCRHRPIETFVIGIITSGHGETVGGPICWTTERRDDCLPPGRCASAVIQTLPAALTAS